MDLKEFFNGFMRLNEEIENFFSDAYMPSNDNIFNDSFHRQNGRNLSPRELMLKQSDTECQRKSLNDRHSSPFHSQSFIQTFNSDANGIIQEKIVVKDSDGNEQIITKHSKDGRVTQKEIHKQGDNIISEKEVVSDIGDDINRISFDDPTNTAKNSSQSKTWNPLSWFM